MSTQIVLYNQIMFIVLGAFVTLLGTIIIDCNRKKKKDYEEKKRIYNLFKAVISEIENGIKRSEGLVNMTAQNTVSFGRIYTALWESVDKEICQYLDAATIKDIHSIYHRFDLINFNFEHDRLGPAHAFAQTYLQEMKVTFNKLPKNISELFPKQS